MNVHPEEIGFIVQLQACANQKDVAKGCILHVCILKRGLLKRNTILGNNIVNMYAKCGSLANAQEVFDELSVRDVVSWTALIAGYAEHGFGACALSCYDQMKCEGLFPNAMTFVCILKACGAIGAVGRGKQIHDEIVSNGLLEENHVLGGALLDMYVKCGVLEKAEQVFCELRIRNLVSWTSLITGYAKYGLGEAALHCFDQMQSDGILADTVTFLSVLKACSIVGAVDKGREIHSQISKRGLLGKDGGALGNAIVDMYAKCGMLMKAQEVFNNLVVRNVVSWTALISGYTQQGHNIEALNCFERMKEEGHTPNMVTLACTLKACGNVGAIELGTEIHDVIVRRRLLEKCCVLDSALVDMYAKCGAFMKAEQTFNELLVRNAVLWTSLISGYVQHGQGDKALSGFELMQCEGLSPDSTTFACVLKAYSDLGAAEKGSVLHAQIKREVLMQQNIILCNALVGMYSKCGMHTIAQQMFDELHVRDIISWNVVVVGYAQHGYGKKALNCYEHMKRERFFPDVITFLGVLKACGSIGAVEKGKEIHAEIAKGGLLDKNIILGNALVNMYAKCGQLSQSQKVFEDLPIQDIGSWNALIVGYAQHGNGKKALECFKHMQLDGLKPTAMTFLCILSACSCSGLVDEGQTLFESMDTSHHITPSIEHLTCMLLLLSEQGLFDDAITITKKGSASYCHIMWVALLHVCRRWQNVEMGRLVFESVIQLDRNFTLPYITRAPFFPQKM